MKAEGHLAKWTKHFGFHTYGFRTSTIGHLEIGQLILYMIKVSSFVCIHSSFKPIHVMNAS